MQAYFAVGLLLLVVIYIVIKKERSDSSTKNTREKSGKDTSQPGETKVGDNAYEGLKNLAYSVSYSQLQLPDPGGQEVLYGVLMDWDYEGKAIITLAAFKTGETSLYFSTGAGFIGGGQHEEVKKAAKMFVDKAQTLLSQADNKDTVLKSESGFLKFYLLTNKGKYTIKDNMENVKNETSFLFPLFAEANNVITYIRMADEKTNEQKSSD